MSDLVNNIAAGIRVLVERDGIEIPEKIIVERAKNIAGAMIYAHGASLHEISDEAKERAA